MNWEIFIGRFHPLLVHLPIGIFVLGFCFELLFQFGYRKLVPSRKIVILTYGLGLLAGVIAAITGWLLSSSNDYGIKALNDHKQLGIATLAIMLIVIIYQVKAPAAKHRLKLAGSTLALLLIALTGHFGGNLTHGPSYLVEYGPSFLQDDPDAFTDAIRKKDPDSIVIYRDLIHPLIQSNCLECHSAENKKGGLKLETYKDLFREANHDVPVLAGNPDLSELFKRISLPKNHEKVMPPRGSGISYTDTQMIRYWIKNGADSLATFNPEKMSDELIALFKRDYGLDFSSRHYYEKIKVDSLDASLLEELRTSGFKVSYLGANNLLLDVEYTGDAIHKEQIHALNQVSGQITFLKIRSCNLLDEMIEEIADLPHLTRADLSDNPITGKAVPFLIDRSHLEMANLNGTLFTGESVQKLLGKSGLSRIYLSNTEIRPEEIAELQKTFADVEIITEFKFKKVEEAKSVFEQEAPR
jgi:uncharacterized membrane protein